MAKALIVEDSSTDAYRALKILEDFFADAKVTNSPENFFDLVESFQPDVIFMDVIFDSDSKDNGFKLTRDLRSSKSAFKDVPVIMLSGKSLAVDIEWAKRCGGSAYIVKPITTMETARALKSVIDPDPLRQLFAGSNFLSKEPANQ